MMTVMDQPLWFMCVDSLFTTLEEKTELKAVTDQRDGPLNKDDLIKVKKAILKTLSLKKVRNDSQQDDSLWSFANNAWNPSPVLQSLNTMCTQHGWTPVWSDDCFSVKIGDTNFKIPETHYPVLFRSKKKDLKAKLGAMALVHHGGVLKKEWSRT